VEAGTHRAIEQTTGMLGQRQAAAEKISADVARTAMLARRRHEQQQVLKATRIQEKQAAKEAAQASALPPWVPASP